MTLLSRFKTHCSSLLKLTSELGGRRVGEGGSGQNGAILLFIMRVHICVPVCPVSTQRGKGGKKPSKQDAAKTTRKTCHRRRRRVTSLTTDDNG